MVYEIFYVQIIKVGYFYFDKVHLDYQKTVRRQ